MSQEPHQPQQQQQQQQQQPLPAFAQKQADDVSSARCAELKAHATACLAKHITGEPLVAVPGRAQVYGAEVATAAGPVKGAAQHPLLTFLATPKLPPELAAYLDPQTK
jgi:hypothetical protein